MKLLINEFSSFFLEHKKWVLVAGRSLVSLSLLLALFWIIDIEAAVESLEKVDIWVFLVIFGVGILQIIITAIRFMISGRLMSLNINIFLAARIQALSLTIGILSHGTLGEILTRLHYTIQQKWRLSRVVAAYAFEKSSPIISLLILAFLGSFILLADNAISLSIQFEVTLIVLSAALLFIATYLILFHSRLIHSLSFARKIQRFLKIIKAVTQKRVGRLVLAVLVVCNIISHSLAFSGQVILARNLGVDISSLHLFALLPLVALFAGLPLGLGGWGLRELAMVGSLGAFGVSASQSLALSLAYGTVTAFATFVVTILVLSMGSMWRVLFQPSQLEK